MTSSSSDLLIDRFGRQVTYVRLSVTDRCDLRCVYCMSEDMSFVPRKQLLTLEEINRIGYLFVEMGVNKVRISGGEPLVRKNIMQVFDSLGKLEGLDDLTVTTNGTLLSRYSQQLKDAGVSRINISLDTLEPSRFKAITRIGKIEKTLKGIDAALAVGFKSVKLNAVVLKNRNHDETYQLVEFVRQRGMDISFIEEMPLGVVGDHDRAEAFYSSEQIRNDLAQYFELTASDESTGGPARYYRMPDSDSRVGFISPHSHNFCSTCNRVRVTAEGMLLLCLGQEHSFDLRRSLRANPGDDNAVKQDLLAAMRLKPEGHDFNLATQPIIMRHMSVTGG